MTLAAGTSSPAKSGATGSPRLRHAGLEDYAGIARLEGENGLESQPESDWRGVWLDNPLWPRLESTWPIGWVLEDAAGMIVGSIMNVPSRYRFQGRDLICANGRAWVADPAYRGFALILMDEYFNQEGADLFVNTTVGPMACDVLNELAVRVPLGDWQSVSYWITGYRGFAGQALRKMHVPMAGILAVPAAASLWIKDALLGKSLPDVPGGFVIEQVTAFDSRFDDFWTHLALLNQDKLLAVRDRAALNWHFAVPLRRNRLRIVTASRGGELRAWAILKRHDQAGGFTRMRLVDYQTIELEIDPLPALLKSAVAICAREKIDILDNLGREIPKMRAFDDLAPHRHRIGNWPFYYRANDAALRAQLAGTRVWDPSSYDGDASFE
jgi:hypothetical protein